MTTAVGQRLDPEQAGSHTRGELARIVRMLASALGGPSDPAAPRMRGFAIGEGDVMRYAAELGRELGESPRPSASPARADLRDDEGPARRALPLVALRRAFSMERAEYDALLLAVGVEVDFRFGRILAYLNDHAQKTRPTLGLVAVMHGVTPSELLVRRAFREGLLVTDGEGPLPEVAFRVEGDVALHVVTGAPRDPSAFGVTIAPPDAAALSRLVLGDDVRSRAEEWVRRVRARDGRAAPLFIVGARGSGRATLARAVAGAAGIAAVEIATPAEHHAVLVAKREAHAHGGALVVRCGAALDGALDLLRSEPRALMVTLVREQLSAAVDLLGEEPATITVDDADVSRRAALYRALLPSGVRLEDAEIDRLAARFRFGPRAMHRAVRRAEAELSVAPEGERRFDGATLERACRGVGASAMGMLAQRLPLPYTRADLVVPSRVTEELDLALAWVAHQRRVLGEWGLSRRVAFGHGLTALFAGPPGTGKTMAAQVVGAELGMDVYRVDLSRVVSKYIGETEKNLATVFDEARAAGGVLFFDEADAMFGKRSEVKDSHDRYANLEIGFLLQKMEEHDGVTVLATNRMRDLDPAFVRRFHVIVDFPLPTAADRERIWRSILGPIPGAADLDVASLAKNFEISGGEIKNAVLAAAFMAAASDGALTVAHVRRALLRELLKAGKVVDAGRLRADSGV